MKPHYILALGLVLILLTRLPMLWQYYGWSNDIGSYLMTRNSLLGVDVLPFESLHNRPPLIGVFLLPFTTLLGDIWGPKILALLVSVLVGVPFYAFTRRWLAPNWALVATFIFVLHPYNADGTVGGFARVLALGLAVWAWHWQMKSQEGRLIVPLAAIPIWLLVGTNQTMVGYWLIVAGALWFWGLRPENGLRRGALLLSFALAALFWLPWYPGREIGADYMVPGSALVVFNPTLWPFTGWLMWSGNRAELFHLVLLSLLLFHPRMRSVVPLLAAGLILGFIGMLSSGDSILNNLFHRGSVAIVPLAVLGLGVGLQAIGEPVLRKVPLYFKRAIPLWTGLLIIFTLVPTWFYHFDRTAVANETLTPDSHKVIEWVLETTEPDSHLYVYPSGLAWWVGGMGQRQWSQGWTGRPLGLYTEQYDAFLCAMNWVEEPCYQYQLRDQFGIDYIFIQMDYHQIRQMTSWEDSFQAPWLQVVQQEGPYVLFAWKAPGATLEPAAGPFRAAPTTVTTALGTPLVALIDGTVWSLEGKLLYDLRNRVPESRVEELAAWGLLHILETPKGVMASYLDPDLVLRVENLTQSQVVFSWQLAGGSHPGGAMAWDGESLYLSIGEGIARLNWDETGAYREFTALEEVPSGSIVGLCAAMGLAGSAGVGGDCVRIVAHGLRHPWRMALAPEGLYVADAGEGRWEEVDLVPLDGVVRDYGWPALEGPECLDTAFYILPEVVNCDPESFTTPVLAYAHWPGAGYCTIVGSDRMWRGEYLYADYCGGTLWAYDPDTGRQRLLYEGDVLITAMGGVGGEVYLGVTGKGGWWVAKLLERGS